MTPSLAASSGGGVVVRAKPLVCVLIAVLSTSAVTVGWAAHGRQTALAGRSTYDVAWIASQTSVEYGRLTTALAAAAAGGGSTPREPALRLDVFLARVADLEAPDFRAFLASDPAAAEAAARVEAEVPDLRRLVEGATARPRDGSSPRPGTLFAPLARLVGAAHRWGLAQAEAAEAQVSALYLAYMALTAGMTACCVALVVCLMRQNRRVSDAADRDALTGLANRHRLSREMAAGIAAARGFAVLYLDLDRFKPVNDAYGHAVGDALLAQVARRLEALLSVRDVVARLGGDEFVILQGGQSDRDAAVALAERVVAAISVPFVVGGREVRVGTSVGVARYPDDGLVADDLLREADAALYHAKRTGAGACTSTGGVHAGCDLAA